MKNSKVGRCVSAKLQLRGGGGDQEWGKNDPKNGLGTDISSKLFTKLKKKKRFH